MSSFFDTIRSCLCRRALTITRLCLSQMASLKIDIDSLAASIEGFLKLKE